MLSLLPKTMGRKAKKIDLTEAERVELTKGYKSSKSAAVQSCRSANESTIGNTN